MKLSKREKDSILRLAKALIKTPSQSYINDPLDIIDVLKNWLKTESIPYVILKNEQQKPVAIHIRFAQSNSKPIYCLNACIDTAPDGDLAAWDFPPNSAKVKNNWLYGRGSADCKTIVSIFCHLAKAMRQKKLSSVSSIDFLFDADEHTGDFGGIKSYIKKVSQIDGMMIGYPGEEFVNFGARGFYRASIKLFGKSGHTGSSKHVKDSAIDKTYFFLTLLRKKKIPSKLDKSFGHSPKMTITSIESGTGFSIYPAASTINIDFRLTPTFDEKQAKLYLSTRLKELDKAMPSSLKSRIIYENSWPPYKLNTENHLVKTLLEAANHWKDAPVNPKVCGPSNIGNFLSTHGIDATCGFGLKYKNIHAPNESIHIPSIESTFQSYAEVIRKI